MDLAGNGTGYSNTGQYPTLELLVEASIYFNTKQDENKFNISDLRYISFFV
jgi:hypothetical protein